jgi:hypothetical protein
MTDTTYNKMFSTVVDCESVSVLFTILAQEWRWIVIDDVQSATVTSWLQRSSTAALKKHHNRNHLTTTVCNLNGKVDPSELSSLKILEYNQWLCKSKWSWKGWFRRTTRGKASSRNTSLEQNCVQVVTWIAESKPEKRFTKQNVEIGPKKLNGVSIVTYFLRFPKVL